jgi:hypothetical protein
MSIKVASDETKVCQKIILKKGHTFQFFNDQIG